MDGLGGKGRRRLPLGLTEAPADPLASKCGCPKELGTGFGVPVCATWLGWIPLSEPTRAAFAALMGASLSIKDDCVIGLGTEGD